MKKELKKALYAIISFVAVIFIFGLILNNFKKNQ
jgi:hypothetical protein